MFIFVLYIFIAIVVFMRLFELKDSIYEVWTDEESIRTKIIMTTLAVVMKFVIIAVTVFFSDYFIKTILLNPFS